MELAYQRALEDYDIFRQNNQLSRQSAELTLQQANEAYIQSAGDSENQIKRNQAYITYLTTVSELNVANSTLRQSIAEYQSKIASEGDPYGIYNANIQKAQTQIDANELAMQNAAIAWNDAQYDYNIADNSDAKFAYENAVNSYISAISGLAVSELERIRSLEDMEISIERKKQDMDRMEKNTVSDPVVQSLKDSVKQAEAAQKAAVKAQTQAQNELTRATEKHAEAKTKLTEAEQKLKDMRGLTNNETVQAQIDALDIKIDGYAAKLDAANDDVSKKQEALTTLKSENITEEQARSNYNTAQQAYLSAQQALYSENQEVSEKKAAIDDASDALDDAKDNLADKEAALADRQKELDKAVADSTDTTVKAPIAGTISNVSVTAGSKTEAAQTMCTIFVSDQGYKVTLTVTREQANRIHVGDEAKAQYFWGGECQASVAAIKPDPSDAQRRFVDLNVSGDVTVGQTMTFTLGDRSAEYDTVVPNSAIREDRNGKYVLVVESRSTPLGTRYTAVRVDVQVAASDETQSALSTSLYGNEFIITASTKPINAGDLVRLVNN